MTDRAPSSPIDDAKPLTRFFWRAWSAVGISSLGDGLAFAALPLLAESLSKQGLWVTMVAAASRLPWLLFGLPAGAWTDTRSPRLTMIQMDVVRFLMMLIVAVAVIAQVASIPLLLICAFVIGMADCAHIPAAAAFLPSVVKTGELDRANGYLTAAEITGEQFAGPSLGAVLFAWASWIPFGANAVSFLGSARLIDSVDVQHRTATSRHKLSVRADVAEGLAWYRGNRDLWTLTLFLCVGAAATGMTNSALVLYGKRHLGLTNWQYGVFLSVPALGGILGGWVAFRVWRAVGTRVLVAGSFVGLVVTFTICARTHTAWVAGLAFCFDGFVPPLINTCIRTLRQQGVPTQFLGRVASVGRLMLIGSAFVGAIAAGWIADARSIPAVYGTAAALLGLALVLGGRALANVRLELATA